MTWQDYLKSLDASGKPPKHKTFLSFHHEDEDYRKEFEEIFSDQKDDYVSMSVDDGDIDDSLPAETIRQKIRDEYIRDATITIVLIGKDTWKRKHVDWEIGSSIRQTTKNPRNGLLGIILPSYRLSLDGIQYSEMKSTAGGVPYNPKTIPPRLSKNIANGFAMIYSWPTSMDDVRRWIHEAFLRRTEILPDNSYPSFGKNRDANQTHWQD